MGQVAWSDDVAYFSMRHCISRTSPHATVIIVYCGVRVLWASQCSPAALCLGIVVLWVLPCQQIAAYSRGRVFGVLPCLEAASYSDSNVLRPAHALTSLRPLDVAAHQGDCKFWTSPCLLAAECSGVTAYCDGRILCVSPRPPALPHTPNVFCARRRPYTPVLAMHCSGYVLHVSLRPETATCLGVAGVLRWLRTPGSCCFFHK